MRTDEQRNIELAAALAEELMLDGCKRADAIETALLTKGLSLDEHTATLDKLIAPDEPSRAGRSTAAPLYPYQGFGPYPQH